MPATIVKLKVADFANWKREFDQLAQARIDHGWSEHTIYRDPTDASAVFVVAQVADLDRARAYFGSEAVRQGVQRAGVQGPPEIWYLSEAEETSY